MVYVVATPANCEEEVIVDGAGEVVIVVMVSFEDAVLELVVVEVEGVLVVELAFLLGVDMGVVVALIETEVVEIPIASETPIPRMITTTTTIAAAMILLFFLPPAVLFEESKSEPVCS